MEERITDEEAAAILNTSVDYVHQLSALHRIESHPVLVRGETHNSMRLMFRKADVLAFKAQDDEVRKAMVTELSRLGQEL